MPKLAALLAVVVAAFCLVGFAAQGTTGSVSGVVKKPDGTPASGVTVKFTGQNVGRDDAQEVKSATTNAEGRYTASGLAAKLWKYEVGRRGDPDGFARGVVTVTAGQTTQQDIQLK